MQISKIHKIPSLPKISVPSEKVEILVENPTNEEEWGFFIDLETMSHLSRFIHQLRTSDMSYNSKRRFRDLSGGNPMLIIHEELEEWDEDEHWVKKNTNRRFQVYLWTITHIKELIFATFVASSVAIYTLFSEK
jgi:hypothetical protein